MKKLAGMVLLSLSTGAIAGGTQINDNNVFYYYESRADIRTPDTKLAEMISVDYRTARDEFTRHDLFEQIKPVLEEKLNQAKANNLVSFQITGNLGEYDFERKAFPTGFGKGSYIPFGNSYAATFENAEDLSFIDIPPSKPEPSHLPYRKAGVSASNSKEPRWQQKKTIWTGITPRPWW